MLLRLSAVLALSYLIIMLLMWLFQAQLLYLPGQGREQLVTPADIGLEWRAAELTTDDDLMLDAWWLPAENPRAALLFLHGNAGNISHRLSSLEQFNRLGLSVLILDYRGYGKSEGRPSEAGTALKDLLTIQGGHNTGFLRSETTYLRGIDDFLSGAGLNTNS